MKIWFQNHRYKIKKINYIPDKNETNVLTVPEDIPIVNNSQSILEFGNNFAEIQESRRSILDSNGHALCQAVHYVDPSSAVQQFHIPPEIPSLYELPDSLGANLIEFNQISDTHL